MLSASEERVSPPVQRQTSCVQAVTELPREEKDMMRGRGEEFAGPVLELWGSSEWTEPSLFCASYHPTALSPKELGQKAPNGNISINDLRVLLIIIRSIFLISQLGFG